MSSSLKNVDKISFVQFAELYQSISNQNKSEDGNVYNTAETQRKIAKLVFVAASESLDNAGSCDMLDHNLNIYTNTVDQNGSNIYDALLQKAYPDIANNRQKLKVPEYLPEIQICSYMTDLICTPDQKVSCRASEKIGHSEAEQFINLFSSEDEQCLEPSASKAKDQKLFPTELFREFRPHKSKQNYSHAAVSTDSDETFESSEKEFKDPKNEDCSEVSGSVPKKRLTLEEKFNNLDKLSDKLQKPKKNDWVQSVSANNKTNAFQNLASSRKQNNRNNEIPPPAFVTAREEFDIQEKDKFGNRGKQNLEDTGQQKELGSKRSIKSKFISPLLSRKESSSDLNEEKPLKIVGERLKNIEEKMVELIMAEIMDQGASISWDDIAGLKFAKSAIKEAVVWPMLRPDIFTGLRRPPKGILLFGPPGTGKTLIGKCVAAQSKSTFFCISASSLTSKWIGDGEKMVRALFAVARVHQPAVIFIDEVDSLLTQRSDTEHESSRRMKTEFLVQLDGATTDNEERLLVIGATNRPQELDEAARRRFVKRLYIPLPDYEARLELLKKLIFNEVHSLTDGDFSSIAKSSDGYSGADIKNLCSEAALGPIRSINFDDIENIQAADVRKLAMTDFETSLKRVRPSVSQADLVNYIKWNDTYGSGIGI
ncbi:unnamed protein product [Ceutorhynchus assimilis]|uniref:Fidgetin-like protein 1 n=1 Tax=Ceutorhynchus assimilis TaxID=467358 RepID=A0A9N9MT30_9CUCU|nr:unnamed protein product [Ceutorhynchus assimilis]